MSEPLRVAVVVEGPTDAIVLQAIVTALLPDVEVVFQTLQPEGSAAFGPAPLEKRALDGSASIVGVVKQSWRAAGPFRSRVAGFEVLESGDGFPRPLPSFPRKRESIPVNQSRSSESEAVKPTLKSPVEGRGSVSGSSALSYHDALIVHVDADVAGSTYASGNIHDAPSDDLPCEAPCPPPESTTDALRAVVLTWLGEDRCPRRVVMCTPSKSIEAWVLAAVWPDNNVVRRDDWECRPNPEDQLRALPKSRRFEKRPDDYRRRRSEMGKGWPSVSTRLTEAGRFERELLAAVAAH